MDHMGGTGVDEHIKYTGGDAMRIGLIDVDGHNFPSVPLMKLSAWHKRHGDSVEWYDPLTAWQNPCDRAYNG